MTRGVIISLSHGGGPLPLLGDPTHKEITASMKNTVPKLLKLNTIEAPKAIILVTAHWQEDYPTISSGKHHDLMFDYRGFPAESYKFRHDAEGHPEIAQRIYEELEKVGLKPKLDPKRGWDHGVFVPMILINPEANIPIVQLSTLHSEDVSKHFALGTALSSLREENISIIGSGFASLHNFEVWRNGLTSSLDFQNRNKEFSKHVTDAVQTKHPTDRETKFSNWRNWPNSYEMHPPNAAEHFLPLIVCSGCAGSEEAKYYIDTTWQTDIFSYYWE